MKIVTDEARPVSELRRTVPPNIAAVISTALEKLPADRFEGASGFAAALSDSSYGDFLLFARNPEATEYEISIVENFLTELEGLAGNE